MNKLISGVVLAGGKSRRFQGQNKAFLPLGGKAMVEYVIENLQRQVSPVLVVCNSDAERFQKLGLETLADQQQDQGPLGGIVSALHHMDTPFAHFVPCDVPFFPELAEVMLEQTSALGKVACLLKDSNGMLHPTFCLIHRSCRFFLDDCLKQGRRKLQEVLLELDHSLYIHTAEKLELYNVNTPQDLETLRHHVE